jgi:hypothetical protein
MKAKTVGKLREGKKQATFTFVRKFENGYGKLAKHREVTRWAWRV